MAAAVRKIKTKAIDERAQKDKEQAKENAKAWYNGTEASGSERVSGEAWEDNAQPVAAGEPPTRKPKKGAKKPKPIPTGFWKFQPVMRRFYESNRTQIMVAVLIMLNCAIAGLNRSPSGLHGPACTALPPILLANPEVDGSVPLRSPVQHR